MAGLFEAIKTGLQEGGRLPPHEAERLAVAVIEWGGESGLSGVEYYWPKKVRGMPIKERNAAIQSEFNGQNLRAVKEKYGVSHTTIYTIVRGPRF